MHCELTVQWDPMTGEHLLEFPDGMLKEVGWEIGDNITWTDNKDGSFSLSKTPHEWQQLELSLS